MPVGRFRGRVRIGRLAIFTGLTFTLVVGALHIPPFLMGGADPASPVQRLYAANLWSQVQVSLVLIACFLPWLAYALLWPGATRGALVVAAVTVTGTALATALTVVAIGTYAALPDPVGGIVNRLQGRTIQLAGEGRRYYLALSDDQMTSASKWLKPGTPVLLWVSRRGQVGALERAATAEAR